jgi:CRISPR/Cas system-associated protein endoribonuclease Cas2
MKAKLPFTEKFLWDLYKFMDKSGDLLSEILPKEGNSTRAVHRIFSPGQYVFMDDWRRRYVIPKIKARKKQNFSRIVAYLRDRGYLKCLKIKNKDAVVITSKGIDKIFRAEIKSKDKIKRKDRKWQMVLFDIPETKKKQRDLFRKALQYLGYKKLQKSIWVCPYDVLKETKNLIKRYGLDNFVDFLLVQKIGSG